jgi:uncharacterized protein YndB with AHSA1/START domain
VSDLKFEVIYPAAISAVWRALTDPVELSEWLMPNDFRPVVGHEFRFVTEPRPGFDGIVRCEVRVVRHERQLAYTWVGGGIDTVVEWTLAPHGAGTALTLIHSGFEGVHGFLVSRILSSGWRSRVLKALGEHVLSGSGGKPDCSV